jgi:methanogenic corrinoid protein MtbC1
MAQDGYQDIDLTALSDEELVEQMHNDLYDGMAAEITQGTNILLGRGWGPDRVLNDALVEGMRIVGIDFRDGILFVPEVLLAANAMKAGMAILRPLLAETGAKPVGKVVIGTVKGDIHDIGKNLVAMMLRGNGYKIVDLGVDVSPDKYLEAAKSSGASVIALSALLTTTMVQMKAVVEAVEKAGLGIPVVIGGAPVTREYADQIRARGYAPDAASAVEEIGRLIAA